jgi:surfeit locus 1 family protein
MHLTLPWRRSTARLQFRPRWWSTLLVAGLIPCFVALGNWQLGKAHAKEAAQARLDGGRTEAAVTLPTIPVADPEALHLQPVSVRGEYEPAGQILIDNRVQQGRAGYHVVTPLRLAGSDMRVLVNRGWLPVGADRQHLPAIDVPRGPVVISGTVVVPSRRFYALAPDTAPAGGNALWQNLDLDRYRSTARHPVQPLVIQLAATSDGGFDRNWPRLDERHERNLSYAYQWYGFALASFGIWVFFAVRGRREAE